MVTLPEVAEQWRAAGVSVVPIVAKNQPAIRWKQYQLRVPNLDEVHDWWGNGHRYGLAIICGNVSGNLEMTELEARALTSTALTDIANAADSLGCGETWDQLLAGYVQQSPTGGMHLVYRIADHEVPGNEKVAMDRSAVNDKGDLQPLVLSETRGDGGYFVGAPSPGFCHPSGEPWLLTCGTPGVVPTISWDQRCLIHEAIKRALDIPSPITSEPANLLPARLPAAAPGTVPPPQASVPLTGAASISPGDHWASETDWAEILEPAGWTLMQRMNDGERLWVRPGKNRRDGHSASTDYQGKPGLYVWSTSTGLDTEIPLTKLFIHAHYSFNGDMSAAARDLVRQGFGSRQVRLQDLTKGELVIAEPGTPRVHRPVPYSDFGNAQRLWKRVGDRFRWVHDANVFYSYVDGRWDPEHKNAVIAEWNYETAQMYDEGVAADSVKDVKWATSSANAGRTNAAVGMMKSISGVSVGVDDFDQLDHLVNLVNGELNLTSGELGPHDPTHLMSRRLNAKFDPSATAPHWDSFLAQVLPDEQTRKYVQRAVAYTLLGRADHRSFFIVYGPTGTGKSQFLSTLEHVFGDYGGSAAEGTFHPGQGSLTNDLHGLRNKRLITTSETADGTSFNENLMKRLTGRDQIVSRELYQSNVTWTPECTIWIATNHPPRFNSDDNAIWRRAKLIPFMTEFGTDSADIPDYARKYLYAEADGILNWILEGLRDFLANGLQEPSDVVQAQVTHREQSDSVVRFLDDQFEEEVLVAHKDGQVRTQELYLLYEDWCRAQGEKRLGSRRFLNRMTASGRATYSRTSTQRVWKGIYRPGSHLVPQLLDR